MKPKTIFYIIFLIFFGTVLICASVCLNYTDKPIPTKEAKMQDISLILPPKPSPAKSVSEDSGGIESYILKYEPETDKIILITCYKDKSRHSTHIPSINPVFLEEEDINMLTEGIELTNKEDMLILIEDYSS